MKKVFKKKWPLISLPYTLRHGNIFILPTWHGLLFVAVLLGMLIGSVNYNNNLGFLLTFLLGSMSFVSIFYTYKNLEGIKIASVSARPASAGEIALFDFNIQGNNIKRAAVSFKFDKMGETKQDLQPDINNRIQIGIKSLKRGMLKPGLLIITSRFPLGIFFAWSKIRIEAECLVYPKPLSKQFPFVDNPSDHEDALNTDMGQGVDEFQDLRSYKPGDSLGRISWKTFSRGQGLFTKTFSGASGTSVMLDWDAVKQEDIELKLSALSYGVLSAHKLNYHYGLKLPGTSILPDSGDLHRYTCLKVLALYGA